MQCINIKLTEGILYHVSNKITRLNPAAWFMWFIISIIVIIIIIIMKIIKAVGDSRMEYVATG